MDRAKTGRTGEAVAARYYQKQGCELVGHNYRTRMFCEVKTRAKDSLDTPLREPRRHIWRSPERQSDEPVRFDVAEVVPLDSGRWMVHIIKGAFWAKS